MKMTKRERQIKFMIELIKFFKGSVCGTADSVKTLAKIQENFPEEYKDLQASRMDPTQMEEIMENIPKEDRDILLLVYVKMSYIAPRMTKLYDLSVKDKNILAADMEEYGAFVESELKKLVSKIEKAPAKKVVKKK